MSQIKSLKFDVFIDYAHQLQLGSLMLYNHYASMYRYYSVMIIGLYLKVCYFGQKNVCCINAPVTEESDYRTILKVDPIVLILKSELHVPILKIDRFAVTPV